MATKKKAPSRVRALPEGGCDIVTVKRTMGDVSVTLSRKVLRYLNVNAGDKIQILARSGSLEISPLLSVEEEIEKYISQ